MEAELETVKEQLRQEKERNGYVDFPDFRTFCLLVEIGKRDPQFVSETLAFGFGCVVAAFKFAKV